MAKSPDQILSEAQYVDSTEENIDRELSRKFKGKKDEEVKIALTPAHTDEHRAELERRYAGADWDVKWEPEKDSNDTIVHWVMVLKAKQKVGGAGAATGH